MVSPIDEPAAGNPHGGLCEGGAPMLPWPTYPGTKLETADTAKERLQRIGLLYSAA